VESAIDTSSEQLMLAVAKGDLDAFGAAFPAKANSGITATVATRTRCLGLP
jgi:hypothetical protein